MRWVYPRGLIHSPKVGRNKSTAPDAVGIWQVPFAEKVVVFNLHQPAGVIPLRTKLAWGAPAFATSSLTFLIAVYLTDFYVSLVCDVMHRLLDEEF